MTTELGSTERGTLLRWAKQAEHSPEFAREVVQLVDAALVEGGDPAAAEQVDREPDSINPGRSRVEFISVRGRPMVLRHYCRGGMMRHVVRDSFFRLPLSGAIRDPHYRPFEEISILELLRECGVSVPSPVVGAVKHICAGWAYRAVIVTEELPDVQNLLFLSLTAKLQPEEQTVVAELCRKAGEEAAKMVAQQVSHPDLHLGNVLVQGGSRVVLIDFDRANFLRADPGGEDAAKERIRQALIARWNRSLVKHGVGEFIADSFEAGLRGC